MFLLTLLTLFVDVAVEKQTLKGIFYLIPLRNEVYEVILSWLVHLALLIPINIEHIFQSQPNSRE